MIVAHFDLNNAISVKASTYFYTQYALTIYKNFVGPDYNFLFHACFLVKKI